jgi:putative exporter of polyketide antibiotics
MTKYKMPLYWAGSGFGDFTVKLNDQDIAQRTFAVTQGSSGLFFLAFADITAQVKSTGSGVYNLSELDLGRN